MSVSKKRSTPAQKENSIADELEMRCDYKDDEENEPHSLYALPSIFSFVDATIIDTA